MRLGEKIRELRLMAGLTQKQVADEIGVTPAAIGNYEHDVSCPQGDKLVLLFKALSCTPNELFGVEYDESVREHISRYIALDEQGREAVDEVTERESERCSSDREVPIAARGGENPRKIALSPKSGSILDAPDYRGRR